MKLTNYQKMLLIESINENLIVIRNSLADSSSSGPHANDRRQIEKDQTELENLKLRFQK